MIYVDRDPALNVQLVTDSPRQDPNKGAPAVIALATQSPINGAIKPAPDSKNESVDGYNYDLVR